MVPAVHLLCGHLDHYSPTSPVVQQCPVISLSLLSILNITNHQKQLLWFWTRRRAKLKLIQFRGIIPWCWTWRIVLCNARGHLNPCWNNEGGRFGLVTGTPLHWAGGWEGTRLHTDISYLHSKQYHGGGRCNRSWYKGHDCLNMCRVRSQDSGQGIFEADSYNITFDSCFCELNLFRVSIVWNQA